MKLNKNKVYNLSELTSEERKELSEVVKNPFVAEENKLTKYLVYSKSRKHWQISSRSEKPTANAKELFYTLENVQVDCRKLSEEQIEEMCKVFIKNSYDYYNSYALKTDYKCVFMQCDKDGFLIDSKEDYKHTITYEKFMELFSEPKEDKLLQPHYDNTNGSIYKFCNDQKLNAWEFDIIKRVVRCRKKGLFKEDLQKTKDLIDLYLKEFTDEN